MQKSYLFGVIVTAIFAVHFLNYQPVTAGDLSQLETLKAQFLPAEFRNANFSLEDLKKIYRAKCQRASGSDNVTLYREVEQSAQMLMGCLSQIANFSAINEEIETARPLGDLDGVFHKYCTKVPAIETCFRTFNEKIQPCLTEKERNQNLLLLRVSSNLLGFLCSKGGDQIAIFVAEEGPECLEANKEAIANCFNDSFAEFIPENNTIPDVYNLPELVLSPEHCVDFERFEACTVKHLQQCREITPANVAESVFRFVKNETNCRTWLLGKATERSVLRETKSNATPQAVLGVTTLLGSYLLSRMLKKLCIL